MSIDSNELPPELRAIEAVMDSAEKLAGVGPDTDNALYEEFYAIVLRALVDSEGISITHRHDGSPRAWTRNMAKAVALSLLSATWFRDAAREA